MSSLGYAIMFMLCAPDAPACETAAIRASRFETLAQCREAIPESLRAAARRYPAGARLTASCGSLDELCEWHVSALTGPAAPPAFGYGLLHRISMTAMPGAPSAAAASTLSILCRKPKDDDCSG